MFGYVKPFIPELKVYENEIYKAVYCGLCKQLGQSYSQLARLTLSYDVVFLVLFALGISNEDVKFKKEHCIIHPLKKKLCLKSCKSLEKAADISVMFSYFKLIDNINDERFFKKFLSKVGLVGLKKTYIKAKTKHSDIANIVEDLEKMQLEIEKNSKFSLDKACHPTSNCLGLIAKTFSGDLKTQKILYRIGYMVGRYIYIIDALDDLNKDFKTRSFNPFLNRYELHGVEKGSTDYDDIIKKIFKSALPSLNFSVAQLAEAFELLEYNNYGDIIKNIIYFGLKASMEKVFYKYNQKLEFFKHII